MDCIMSNKAGEEAPQQKVDLNKVLDTFYASALEKRIFKDRHTCAAVNRACDNLKSLKLSDDDKKVFAAFFDNLMNSGGIGGLQGSANIIAVHNAIQNFKPEDFKSEDFKSEDVKIKEFKEPSPKNPVDNVDNVD